MQTRIDDAIKEITETLKDLEADAMERAKDLLDQDSDAIAKLAFDQSDPVFTFHMNGVGGRLRPEYPPLSFVVMDYNLKVVKVFDEIQFLIKCCDEDRGENEKEKRKLITTAISALQSGIDRIKAYEAERFKAQP